MNTIGKHRADRGGFTVSEVVLAIGVVAFGLVAVLGVLPAGLTVVKDNREETIIRYEAQYWFNALRAGTQQFDALNQVEWVEIRVWDSGLDPESDPPTEVYRAHRTRLGGDGGGYLPSSGLSGTDTNSFSIGSIKQSSWPQDVVGWLSIPNQLDGRTVKKAALVRPLNSTMFDRVHGRKLLVAKKSTYNDPDLANGDYVYHPLPGGDLSFSYLLEVGVEEEGSIPELYKVNLNFKWPVLEDPTQTDDPSRGSADPVASKNTAADVTFVSKMTFSILVGEPLEEAVSKDRLILMMPDETDAAGDVDPVATNRKRLAVKSVLGVVESELPGFTVTIGELESRMIMPGPPEPNLTRIEIFNALKYLGSMGSIMENVPETGLGSAALNDGNPDDQWQLIRRPYDGQGLYSMRLLGQPGSVANGGYEPIGWGSLGPYSMLLDPFINRRFRGFKSAGKYFGRFFYFVPDNS